jgi:hypothetical protein
LTIARDRHREKLKRDRPLVCFAGAIAGVPDPEDVFAFFEGDFDLPAVGVALYDLCCGVINAIW